MTLLSLEGDDYFLMFSSLYSVPNKMRISKTLIQERAREFVKESK